MGLNPISGEIINCFRPLRKKNEIKEKGNLNVAVFHFEH